jgi:hypothetical protein
LAVLLVAAQITIVSHVDIDGHTVESPCAICVSASTLGTDAVAAVAFDVPSVRSPTPSYPPVVSRLTEPVYAHPARAPPISA